MVGAGRKLATDDTVIRARAVQVTYVRAEVVRARAAGTAHSAVGSTADV
jgi:hypothetical protein